MSDVFRWRTPALYFLSAILSLALISVLLVRTTTAAFTDTTDNTGNVWSAGTVVISDDDSAATMFSVSNMKPTDSSTECITVTYAGSLDAAVRVFGTITAGDGLDDYLNLTVRRGTGGAFGNCTGFSSTEVVYTGTVDGFTTTHTDFGSGAGSWAPTGGAPSDNMTYEFTVSLQDDNAAQGLTSTVSLTWEAQNT